MNEYGLQAMQHWKTWLPTRYEQIEDPEAFFTALGERMATQVGQIAAQLELQNADQLARMDYLERVGLMNNFRLQAQEVVLAEAMPAPPDQDEEPTSDPVADLMSQWMDEDEMPLDHGHRLWTMLEDDRVSVHEFMAANREWMAGLRERARQQLATARQQAPGTDGPR